MVFGYMATYRMQADRAEMRDGRLLPKDRPHYGWQWATTSMVDTPMASRTITGTDLPAFRQRVRLAYGLPGPINYLLGSIMSGFRDRYLDNFGATWTTRGPDALQSSLQGWHVVGVDVANFDSTAPRFLMHFFLDGIAERFPSVGSLLKLALHAPVFTPAQSKDHPPFWTGDPFDVRTFQTCTGLPSGVAFNPDMGKFMGTLQALTIIDDMYGGVVGQVEEILSHRHPEYMLKNSGDDMLIGFSDPSRSSELFAALDDPEHAIAKGRYFVLETEDPITYLGNAVYSTGPGQYAVEPSINSVAVNWFVPERSASSNFRQFPGIGWFMREQHFANSRMYPAVASIRDRVYKHYFGEDPTDYMRPFYHHEAATMGTLNESDLALVEKPERLHYTDAAAHSNVMADVLSAKVPADHIRRALQHHLKS
jgi:hypothetical protein